MFPNGIPPLPVFLFRADNKVATSWLSRATAKTDQGQCLLGILSELLRLEEVGSNAEYLPGDENDQGDTISHPSDLSLSFAAHCKQLSQMYPSMRTWDFFLPSQEFLQLLSSRVFTAASPTLPSLPKTLGHFVPDPLFHVCQKYELV